MPPRLASSAEVTLHLLQQVFLAASFKAVDDAHANSLDLDFKVSDDEWEYPVLHREATFDSRFGLGQAHLVSFTLGLAVAKQCPLHQKLLCYRRRGWSRLQAEPHSWCANC